MPSIGQEEQCSSSRSSSSMTCTNTDTAPLEETAPQRPSSLTRPISSHSVIAGERHTKQQLSSNSSSSSSSSNIGASQCISCSICSYQCNFRRTISLLGSNISPLGSNSTRGILFCYYGLSALLDFAVWARRTMQPAAQARLAAAAFEHGYLRPSVSGDNFRVAFAKPAFEQVVLQFALVGVARKSRQQYTSAIKAAVSEELNDSSMNDRHARHLHLGNVMQVLQSLSFQTLSPLELLKLDREIAKALGSKGTRPPLARA